jgi:hypothetical protein
MILLFLATALAGPSELLDEANAAYLAGDYPQAATTYEALIEAGHPTGDLYYDLGNALYRQGLLPESILAWKRAEQLSPRDGDIRANLDRARAQARDQLDSASSPNPFFWEESLSLQEMAWFAALLWGLLGLLGIVHQRRRDVDLAIPGLLLGLPALLLVVSTLRGFHALESTPPAVVLLDTDVRSAGADSVTLFQLHSGAEVQVVERIDEDWLVSLPDGRKGWVEASHLGLVDPAQPFPQ